MDVIIKLRINTLAQLPEVALLEMAIGESESLNEAFGLSPVLVDTEAILEDENEQLDWDDTPNSFIMDADGNLGRVGEIGRVRLSMLTHVGVAKKDRNFVVREGYLDGVHVELGDGTLVNIITHHFRWGADLTGVQIRDADDCVGYVNGAARLRLSRLSLFGVKREARHGEIVGQNGNGTYNLKLHNGVTVVVHQADFRFTQD